MNAWLFTVECPKWACGSNRFEEVCSSQPKDHANAESKAVVRCVECSTEWVLTATLRPFTDGRDPSAEPRVYNRKPKVPA